jgi:ATP-dependent DNA ligase
MTDLVRFADGATPWQVFLYAFDLLELSGDDLRREPLDVRKTTLRSLTARWGRACDGMCISRAGEAIFRHA